MSGARYKQIVKDAATSLIEAHLETGIELQNWSDMLNLVHLVYPNFDPDVSPVNQGITVYAIEVSYIGGGGTLNIIRITQERVQADIAHFMDDESVDTVILKIEGPATSQESHAL